jgi:phage terminase small subunit
MAGVKGRSGGARPGTGGKRKGAGRKPRAPVIVVVNGEPDPVAFLTSVMQNNGIDLALRIVAAKALLPFKHHRVAASGKKAAQADAAKTVGTGRFASSAPPKLVVDNMVPK